MGKHHSHGDHFLHWRQMAREKGYTHDFRVLLCGTILCLTCVDVVTAGIIGFEGCNDCRATFYLISGKTMKEEVLGVGLEYWD